MMHAKSGGSGEAMGKAVYKVKGGKMIMVQLIQKEGKIDWIKITGDFFLYPEELIEEVEWMLRGSPVEREDISNSIGGFINEKKATLLGAAPEDLALCIVMAGEQDG